MKLRVFFERKDKIDKSLAKLRQERELKIINEKGDIKLIIEIQMIVRGHYEQLYANRLDKIE